MGEVVCFFVGEAHKKHTTTHLIEKVLTDLLYNNQERLTTPNWTALTSPIWNRPMRPAEFEAEGSAPGQKQMTFLGAVGVSSIQQPKNRPCCHDRFFSALSGRKDLNLRPLAPHASALAGLRHAPSSDLTASRLLCEGYSTSETGSCQPHIFVC